MNSRTRLDAGNADLIGHTYHAPGSIALHAVEDIDHERPGEVVVINIRSRATSSVRADDVRNFLNRRGER